MGQYPPCYHYFYNYTINNLLEVKDELLKDIEDALGTRIFPPKELTIHIESSLSSKISAGSYIPNTKTIILSDRLWCRVEFIHELMHAISFFSLPELGYIADREKDFVEGLTEFLTGYVLFSKYRECYHRWISNEYPICSVSYSKYVRLLGAVSQVLIPIRDFIKIYVFDPNIDWFKEYKKFLNRYSLDDFLVDKSEEKRRIPTRLLLKDAIIKVLNEKMGQEKADEFIELFEEAPLDIVLDYSNMIKMT